MNLFSEGAIVKRLIEYPLKDGSSVMVEVDEPAEGGVERAARPGEMIEKAKQDFETVLERIKPIAAAVITALRDLSESPNEIGVEFGVKLSVAAGVVLASAGAEANYKVTLKWVRK